MRIHILALVTIALTFGACKSGSDAAKPSGDTAKASGPDFSAYTTFVTDMSTIGEDAFMAKYPAGKPFEMKAKVKTDGECDADACSVKLADGGSTYFLWHMSPDQKTVGALKTGAVVTIKCNPVYERNALQWRTCCTIGE